MTWREPIKVLADVIQSEMGLDDGHVVLTNQKWPIPKDQGLFVVLGVVSSKVIGNNNYFQDDGAGGGSEVQQAVTSEMIQVDAMSFDSSARARKEEIIMALASQASLRAQSEQSIQIAWMPEGFANTSFLEETAMLNRFTMTLTVKSIRTKTKSAEFYDTFQNTEVTTND
jgi:hypothetical protein